MFKPFIINLKFVKNLLKIIQILVNPFKHNWIWKKYKFWLLKKLIKFATKLRFITIFILCIHAFCVTINIWKRPTKQENHLNNQLLSLIKCFFKYKNLKINTIKFQWAKLRSTSVHRNVNVFFPPDFIYYYYLYIFSFTTFEVKFFENVSI